MRVRPSPPAPHSILLIDDDESFRTALAIRLTQAGFRVTTAASGADGLRALRACPPHLVLLDMLMPGQDGLATYQALRAHPATRQVPVILLTGMVVEHYWEPLPYESDGPCYVMGKPYEAAQVLARVHELLGRTEETA